MCSSSAPDCGYDNGTIILNGDVYCPNRKCSGKLCLHKKTFESLGRSGYQCPQCAFVCQVRNILFADQTILFSFRFAKKFTFLRESRFYSRCYLRCLLSWPVLFQQKEMRIFWWLCNNSEIHLWLWKTWSLVVRSQSSLCVTRARKDNRNRQNKRFLC